MYIIHTFWSVWVALLKFLYRNNHLINLMIVVRMWCMRMRGHGFQGRVVGRSFQSIFGKMVYWSWNFLFYKFLNRIDQIIAPNRNPTEPNSVQSILAPPAGHSSSRTPENTEKFRVFVIKRPDSKKYIQIADFYRFRALNLKPMFVHPKFSSKIRRSIRLGKLNPITHWVHFLGPIRA